MRMVHAALRPTSTAQCPSQSRQPHRVAEGERRAAGRSGGRNHGAVIRSSEARSRFMHRQDVTEMSARPRRMVWRPEAVAAVALETGAQRRIVLLVQWGRRRRRRRRRDCGDGGACAAGMGRARQWREITQSHATRPGYHWPQH